MKIWFFIGHYNNFDAMTTESAVIKAKTPPSGDVNFRFYYLTPRGLSQHLLETARKRSARGLICVTPHLVAIS